MQKQKPRIVKYVKDIMHVGEIDGVKYTEPEYAYHKAEMSFIRRFNGTLMNYMKIEGCAHHLMDWLIDNMTEGNYVSNNEMTRRNFIQFHAKHKRNDKKPYKDNSVRMAFNELSKLGLLISQNRGLYMVNPDWFYGPNDEGRIKSIRMICEFIAGKKTKVSVEVTKDKNKE